MLRVLGGPGDDEGDEDDEYEDVWCDDEDDLRFDDGPDSENDDPEVQAALDAFRAAHEEGWIDSPLPVLGGRTPREAAADDALRPDLVTLLAEMDGPGGGFDTDRARQRLGLTG